MADKEQDGPSLELPSFRPGGRRRRKGRGSEPAAEPTDTRRGQPVDESTRRIEVAPAPEPAPEAPTNGGGRKARKERRRRGLSLPAVGPMTASVVTGLLLGGLTVALTWGGLFGCEAVQGTSSCGGPGLFVLLAILVAMIYLGSFLLRAWKVPDPGSTSFLGVGLLAVLALLLLIDVILSWWMAIVVPVLAMLTFALAHWVTTAFVDPDDM